MTVHLVDDTRANVTTYDDANVTDVLLSPDADWGTCGSLDGIGVGVALPVTNIEVDTSVGIVDAFSCFGATGDVTLSGDMTLTGVRGEAALTSFGSPIGVNSPLVTVLETDAVFGSCTGEWTLYVVPVEIANRPSVLERPFSSEEWSDARVYAQLAPGDPPPVVIQRYFVPDVGADCSVIPDDGDRRCSDSFLGYVSP